MLKRMLAIQKTVTVIFIFFFCLGTLAGCKKEDEKTKKEKMVKRLIKDFKENTSDERLNTAKELTKIGVPAVEPLIVLLEDEDFYIRSEVANILGEINDPRAIAPLIAAMKDPNLIVNASNALIKIGEPAVEPLTIALKNKSGNIRRGAATTFRIMEKISDPDAIKGLIFSLKDRNKHVRMDAAYALGKTADVSAVEPLIDQLKDEDSKVRRGAAVSLGMIGDKRAVEHIIPMLRDFDKDIRNGAAYALGDLKDPNAVEPLIKVLEDREWSVRKVAAYSLGLINDKRAVEPLIKALKDKSVIVREAAAEALGVIGDKRAVEPLMNALKDEDNVRAAAEKALRWMK